jgi:adenylosuccinate lyase
MIQRYTHPDMGRIWSDQRKYETWLQVEIAAVEAMARAGIAPPEAARDIREKGAFRWPGSRKSKPSRSMT